MCICLSNSRIAVVVLLHGFVYIKAHGIVYLFMLIYVNELSLPVKIQAQPSCLTLVLFIKTFGKLLVVPVF